MTKQKNKCQTKMNEDNIVKDKNQQILNNIQFTQENWEEIGLLTNKH